MKRSGYVKGVFYVGDCRCDCSMCRRLLSGCGLPVRSLVFSDRFSRGVVSEVVMAGDSIYTVPEGINQDVGRFVVYDSTFNNPREMGVWSALEGTDGLPGSAYSSVFSGSLVSNTWGPDEFRQEFSINENNVTESGGFEVYSPMVG